jgi:NAD(P)-dependent dehydrogenase (short-subunit alcohol dehydrogenase family)
MTARIMPAAYFGPPLAAAWPGSHGRCGDRSQLRPGGAALGRYGAVEDIANAVVFLANAKAQYITGSTLTVDGGATA